MAAPAVRPSSESTVEQRRGGRWRTVDIVVTAVLGVAFGVVFWAWGLLWAGTGPAFAAFPPGQALMYGVWLVPAVLAPLVVRKAGAGLFAELVAAIVSALLGSAWGTLTIVYGLLQGLAGEAAFAGFGYRRFGWPQALLGGALTGAMAAGLDIYNYYPDWTDGWKLAYLLLVVASTTVIAGIGSVLLARALAASGALSSFASGRTRV
jgi:energy-coupling factor transport system substrate-specific component